MNSKDFAFVLNLQLERVKDMLSAKASEYATDDDRLHNFKVVAELQDISVPEAVVGLMAKHVVSIYDMARDDRHFSFAQWDEKITDNINYLILLRASLEDEFVCGDNQEATKP